MKTLYLLSAIPGSGKSTWARHYKEEHPNTYIVASDEIRKRLFGDVQNFSNEKLVWKTYLSDIHEYAKENDDVTVIADATNLENRFRLYYGQQTPEFDRHVLVLFNIPFEICQIQNRMRTKDRVVPEGAMKRMRDQFEKINSEVKDLYDEIIEINETYLTRKQ